MHVGLAGLALLVSIAGAIAAPLAPPEWRWACLASGPAAFALALLLEVPPALEVLARTRDPAALAYPPVLVLRNIVGAFGYFVGVLAKARGRA